MDLFKGAESLMRMDDRVWARHASGWSVATRFTCLPLIALAIWSRGWIGWWALPALALALIWTWANPRVFPAPAHTDTWAAKGTFGERVLLNRKAVPVPAHHVRWALILAVASALGLVPLIYGLAAYNPWAVLLGLVAVMLPKLWFVDRMVWLYEDMKDADPVYRSWLR